jgi:DNA-binding transcriptional MerR regulator
VDDGALAIGDLARLGGVSVKTVRFYSDRGLLPAAGRSSGGHRRYGADALERLRRIRELRALELPLDEVTRALEGDEALSSVLAARLSGVRDELAALRWRESCLHALTSAPPGEQPELLRLFGALSRPPSTDSVAAFWKLTCPAGLPGRVRDAFLGLVVPELPHAPTPGQAVAYARLHAYTSDRAFAADIRRYQRGSATGPCDGGRLYEGILQAYALAASAVAAGRAPAPGRELDAFVGAYGVNRGERDTARFRAVLQREIAWAKAPRVARYWSLAEEVSPDVGATGAAVHWLHRALALSVADADARPGRAGR